jgi:hypothetical protein
MHVKASVGVRLLLVAVFLIGVTCSKSPTSPTVELVGTMKITGWASQLIDGEIERIWLDEGSADLSAKASVDELGDSGAQVTGSGKGVAGYSAKMPPCQSVAKFDATYTVNGQLSTGSTCMLALQVDIKWTKGSASMTCPGVGTYTEPEDDFSYSLPAIFKNNVREAHSTVTSGGLAWDYRFELQRFDSTGVTRCQFNK